MKSFKDYESMAMLDLPEAERVRLRERFDEIASGFSVLDSYDMNDIEPLITVLDLQNVLRDDVSSKMISRDELLVNAPQQHDGYFRVPAAID